MSKTGESASDGNNKLLPNHLRLVSVIVVVIFVGLCLEGGSFFVLRFRGRTRDVSKERHLQSVYRSHRLNPDYAVRMPDGTRVLLHSPDGFRESSPVQKTKPENTYRIIALGGSTLYGAVGGFPYPERPILLNTQTIDHNMEVVLNERLQNDIRRVEVINAGITAYQTFQHLVYINERLLQYDPDLFVFLDGHNDFYIKYEDYSHWEDYAYGPWQIIRNIDDPSFHFAILIGARYLGRYSNFAYLIHEWIYRIWRQRVLRHIETFNRDKRAVSNEELSYQYPQMAQKTYLRAYRQIKALADYEGIEMMVFLQPEILLEDPESLSAADRPIQMITLEHDTPAKAERMKVMHRMMAPLFQDLGVEFHDLSVIAPTPDSEQLYTDYCHLTPAGAALVGRKMADAVWPRIREWAAAGGGGAPSNPAD